MGQSISSCLSPKADAADFGKQQQKQQQQQNKHSSVKQAATEPPPGSSRTDSSSISSGSSGKQQQQQQPPPVGAPQSCAAAKQSPSSSSSAAAAAAAAAAEPAATAAPAATATADDATVSAIALNNGCKPPFADPISTAAAAVAAAAAAAGVAGGAEPAAAEATGQAAATPRAAGAAAAVTAVVTANNHTHQTSAQDSVSIPTSHEQQQQQQQQLEDQQQKQQHEQAIRDLCGCMPVSPQQQQQQQQNAADRTAGANGVPLVPVGVAPAPGLPHNPAFAGPPLPPCDEERVQDEAIVVELLGTGPRKELDNILKLVCNIFGVENALIALFGERKIWVLNKISMAGIQEGDFEWRHSFCAWTMATEQHQVLVVNDALQDARFADNAMVLQGGVRFYAGSPLVNSRGHRLGTLCFADTKPRVFDTSSLQVLINLSELVSRELESEIVLAKQQYQLEQQERSAAAAAAAAAAVIPIDGTVGPLLARQRMLERYQLLLRSIDCVTSAVLLVDTSVPVWPILHSSTGWQQLQQQLKGTPCSGSNSGSSGSNANSSSSSSSIGQSLWALLDSESMRSRCPGGVTAKQQVLQQVMVSQSFTLRGVRLCPKLGGATVQLVFRCAGFSTVQGAVSICLPSFAPDRSEVAAAAAALSRSSPTGARVSASTTNCDSLYFITVKLSHNNSQVTHEPQAVTAGAGAPAAAAAAAAAGGGGGAGSNTVGQLIQGGNSSSSHVASETPRHVDARVGMPRQQPQQQQYVYTGGFGGSIGSSGQLPGLGSIGVGSNTADDGSSAAPPVIDVVEHPQFSAADGAADRGDRGFVTDGDFFLSDMLTAPAAAAVGSAVPPPRSSPVGSLDSGPLPHVGRFHAIEQVPGSSPASAASISVRSASTVAAAACGSNASIDSFVTVSAAASQMHHQMTHRDYVLPAGAAAAPAAAAAAATTPAAADGSGGTGSSNIGSLAEVLARGKVAGQKGGWRLTVERSSSSGSSSIVGGGGRGASILAGLVCERVTGLNLGGQIAAGSYGRVYKGSYFGSKVAVKVLDGADVLRQDAATNLSLEALLSSGLKHPSIVSTLAWAVVSGKGQLPARVQVWGQTLDPSKPSIAQNCAAVVGAAQPQQQQQQQQQQQYGGLRASPDSTCSTTPSGSSSNNHPTSSSNSRSSNTLSGSAAAVAAAEAAQAEAFDAAGAVVGGGGDESSEDDDDSSSYGSDLLAQVAQGQTWLIMEFCDRGCLQDACERGWLRHRRSYIDGPINLAAVLATACEIASGMALLHSKGVVHGDLSAFNVMLSSNDPGASAGGRGFVAKVADFGLARTLTNNMSKVVTKTYGTITHMPPEMLEHGVSSKAADVYSFGVLLWQMVTGSRAWAGLSHSAVVQAVCVQKLQLQFPEGAPEALAMLGQASLSYDPADRPAFEDILEVLEPCQALLAQ